MNVEHRTSNIERRIMMSLCYLNYFKIEEQNIYIICGNLRNLQMGLRNRMNADKLVKEIENQKPLLDNLFKEIGKIIIGQSELIKKLLIALFCNGHVLVDGVPGLAKTTALKTLAKVMDASFQRIQFTPDLLPADIIGIEIYRPDLMEFSVKKGPIFSHIILADEINRAPAKVQSALLEAMQEQQVTIAGETFSLEEPFLVMATQNPIEQDGTYPLPEAQLDRFLLKINITYPSKKEEKKIVQLMADHKNVALEPALSIEKLAEISELVKSVYLDEKLLDYITDIVFASRFPEEYDISVSNWISCGASPRASISLAATARAHAFMEGRGFVIPHDIKSMAPDVLRHRIILSYEAEAAGKSRDEIIAMILGGIEIP